jgi:hypothetical protein
VKAVSWKDEESRLKALGKLAHLQGRLVNTNALSLKSSLCVLPY